ncbi:MAG: hypothetical protein BMS9Abin37_0257 [Acidobacteriota bacterium]|nr:MAG: hypothetical protein BMS9Abin37_0257 [Acidobacteriota bacterium]
MKRSYLEVFCTLFVFLLASSAWAVPVTFTQLTGLTGGAPMGTAVYQADLSSIGLVDILPITISDNSGGLGGATGQFSGFDLDAIKLSTTNCGTAGCTAALAGLSLFDFTPAGTFFTPGTQRDPVDSKLFGTDAGGSNVDNPVETLGSFERTARRQFLMLMVSSAWATTGSSAST